MSLTQALRLRKRNIEQELEIVKIVIVTILGSIWFFSWMVLAGLL